MNEESRSKETKPKSCAIYARTERRSTDEIDRQVAACASRASELGAEIQDIYVDDGASGGEIGESLHHLLAAAPVRGLGLDYLVVEDEARLSPSMACRLFILAELSTADIIVETVSEPFGPREPSKLDLGLHSGTSK